MKIGQPESIFTWEPGMYPARVKDVEETVSTYPGSEGKPRLKFVLEVKDEQREDGDQTTDIWYFTGATLSKHPAATLRPLVRVLMPDLDLDDPDAELDTDDLKGKRCRVVLGINEEKGRNTVDKVLAPESKRAVPRQQMAAVASVREDGPGF